MIATKKILALILARSGSKGIPHKNIVDAYGKPLIEWSIVAAKKSKYIDNLYVSSDCQRILNLSTQLGANTILRPDALATDTASSEGAIQHSLLQLKEQGQVFDYLILLQPTSPARTSLHIDRALEKFSKSDATSLISVFIPQHSPYKSFTLNNRGFLTGLVNDNHPFMARQLLPDAYYPNGAIYIISCEGFLNDNSLYTSSCIPFIMSTDESIDIDSPQDILEFNQYMELKNEGN